MSDSIFQSEQDFMSGMAQPFALRYKALVADVVPSVDLGDGNLVTRRAAALKLHAHALSELKMKADDARRYAKDQTTAWRLIRTQQLQRALKSNASLLPHEVEIMMDSLIVPVAQRARVGLNHLLSRGLTSDAGDIGTFLSRWQSISEHGKAQVSMGIQTDPRFQRQVFNLNAVPLPIIQSRFQFDIRELTAAEGSGAPLDTTHIAGAIGKVAEAEEDMLFNGVPDLQYGGFTLPGYLTHPATNSFTGASVGGGDFGTIGNIYPTFLGGTTALRLINRPGPYAVYVSIVQFNEMQASYADVTGETALQRAMRITGIEIIEPSQYIPDGELVIVELSRNTVDLAIAQEITTVQWENEGGAVNNWRVFSCKAPRIKVDANGNTGIVHITGI